MTFTITRDRWGIAHVSAPDELTAFRAQGWVHAEDRIWQMEYDRRRATGTWAEVVGMAGAREDAFFRRMGLGAHAQADWDALDDATRAMTSAYAEGVNAWLAAHGDALPSEFEHHPVPPAPWDPWHCLAVYKVRHVFMGTFHRKLWRAALTRVAGPEAVLAMRGDPGDDTPMIADELSDPDLLADAAAVVAAAADELRAVPDVDGGSNSWALSGARTASGRPLLAGDPHRGIEFPNVYHQMQVGCPEFDVIGLSFPGVPGFPHFGHNADVAWCITHGMADDTDVFIERFDDASPGWRPEQLHVRGEEEPITVWCGETDRGPVVLGDPADGVALGMMWTGIAGADTTFACLRPMLSAGSCADLEEAVRDWVIPVNNLLTADRHGDISFKVRGRVVERTTASRWVPVPGQPEFGWEHLEPVAFDDLPGWRNPDRGFLVTANNRIADAGPYISLDFAGPARHDRIVDRLSDLTDATPEDMQNIHVDVYSTIARRFCDRFAQVEPETAMGREALALLRAWDHEMSETSVEASIYAVTRRMWVESVGTALGVNEVGFGAPGWPTAIEASRALYEGATRLLLDDRCDVVPGLRPWPEVLATCLDGACLELATRLGDDMSAWSWGPLHRMASPHPLASLLRPARELHPPIDGCPGDTDTVRCGSVLPETGERAAAGSVARYVFDLADWDNSGWVVPHGVSGVRGSGHDLDQRAAWLAGDLLPMAYTERAIELYGASVETIRIP